MADTEAAELLKALRRIDELESRAKRADAEREFLTKTEWEKQFGELTSRLAASEAEAAQLREQMEESRTTVFEPREREEHEESRSEAEEETELEDENDEELEEEEELETVTVRGFDVGW